MKLLVLFIGILALASGAVSQHIGGTIEMIECCGCEDILERPIVAYPKLVGYGAHNHEGVIGIQALIDRAGDVVSAKALYGHPYFRSMLERAAEQAKFKAANSGSERKAIFVFKVTPPTSETPIIGHAPPGIKPVYLPTPEYPPAASFVGIEGKVKVSVVVNEVGNVSEARVTSGHPFFHANSLKAATSARFEPLRIGGRPVRFRTLIVFDFKRPSSANRPKQESSGITSIRLLLNGEVAFDSNR